MSGSFLNNPASLLVSVQSVITALKAGLRAPQPIDFIDLDSKLDLLSDTLVIAHGQVSELLRQKAETVERLSECEDLAEELMDELDDLEKYNPLFLSTNKVQEIAKDLYGTAEDLYFLLSQGVE